MSRFLDDGEPGQFEYGSAPRRGLDTPAPGHRWGEELTVAPSRADDDGGSASAVMDAMIDTRQQEAYRDGHDPGGEWRGDGFAGDGYVEDPGDPTASALPAATATTRRRWSRTVKSLLAVVLSLGVLAGGGYMAYTKLHDGYISFISVPDYPGPGDQTVVVTIPQGASISQMGDILTSSGVVASRKAFVQAAQANSASAGIQPGDYQLKTKMSGSEALTTLLDPTSVIRSQVTVPEGLRDTLVVAQVSQATGIAQSDLDAALANPGQLGLPSYANGNPEGFLFPNTYAFSASPTAVEVLSKMTAEFGTIAQQIQLQQKAAALGISPYEAVIVASIIEKETTNPVYGPDIAQVIYNRLRTGMPLQLDSTVIYASNSSGTITTTNQERANPSPYNTYVHQGLPPGPISNPGQAALTSAVNPTQGSYLYFVAVNPDTGETKFASDAQGHAANVAQFQAWCQANSSRCG